MTLLSSHQLESERHTKSIKEMGRPRADDADRVRMKLWYWQVKFRCGWSDYQMDGVFVDDGALPGMFRKRRFELIRKRGIVPMARVPKGNAKQKRHVAVDAPVPALIQRVAAYKDPERKVDFSGTDQMFSSPLWVLLKQHDNDPEFLLQTINRCLERLGAIRPSETLDFYLSYYDTPHYAGAPLKSVEVGNSSKVKKYVATMKRFIRRQPLSLDLIALLAALFREACLLGQIDIAFHLREWLENALGGFCEQPWIPEDFDPDLQGFLRRRLMGSAWHGTSAYYRLYDGTPEFVPYRPVIEMSNQLKRLMVDDHAAVKKQLAKGPAYRIENRKKALAKGK